MSRLGWAAGGIVVGGFALLGALLIAVAFVRTDDPRDWLDDNATAVSTGAWTAPEAPLRFADRIAQAVPPQSRIVNSWGVALRYRTGSLTITAGSADGTSAIYWDSTRSAAVHRSWRLGRWPGGGGVFEPVPTGSTSGDGRSATGTAGRASAVELAQTRRVEDFRGGGPGGGK